MYSHARGGHASGAMPVVAGSAGYGMPPGYGASNHRPIGLPGQPARAPEPPQPYPAPAGIRLTVLAVDDEEPALLELAHLLGEDPRVDVVLTAPDATEALRILHGSQTDAATPTVDVVFLDIRMPGLDGLELARVLNAMADPPPVVFVTAHDDRAVDAYEVGAVDYLLKPLRGERLSGSLDRTIALRTTHRAEAGGPPPGAPAAPAPPGRRGAPPATPDDEVVPVELAGTTKLVPRSSIRFVEAQGDYARLHTTDGSHLVRIPVSVLEDRWGDAGFVRIHRAYLVALPLITELRMAGSGYVVRLGNGPSAVELPVSRRHTAGLKRILRGRPPRPQRGPEDGPDGPILPR
ncbi:LytR/AlgR family response regulator transcription factor [Pseudonocardia parietis]|uniref:DNA-binding LytR/AlgR family response regulator n=1 Tax=Pseudonocardia parietis TaxID=570936 RepID=A0ABS4W2R6_9PSEU|nr:LytTR family DNA-binding domain-containing protein [Pseudonocardia parietis]MBP2370474.1 DNA-binding LytR/AlgR family response regulator [Pseudonocardia parietis]